MPTWQTLCFLLSPHLDPPTRAPHQPDQYGVVKKEIKKASISLIDSRGLEFHLHYNGLNSRGEVEMCFKIILFPGFYFDDIISKNYFVFESKGSVKF